MNESSYGVGQQQCSISGIAVAKAVSHDKGRNVIPEDLQPMFVVFALQVPDASLQTGLTVQHTKEL